MWIVDDVNTAGTAIRQSLEVIRSQGATAAGVLIALDRQERGEGTLSAAQEVQAEFGIPIIAVARLDELLVLVDEMTELQSHRTALQAYRVRYGVA